MIKFSIREQFLEAALKGEWSLAPLAEVMEVVGTFTKKAPAPLFPGEKDADLRKVFFVKGVDGKFETKLVDQLKKCKAVETAEGPAPRRLIDPKPKK